MAVESTRVSLMGTVIEVQVEADAPRRLLEDAVRLLHVYEHRFSANDPDSELGELNRAAGHDPVRVHPQLFELIALGTEHSLAPGSMLNIAIGPVVQLWRIGFSDANVPSQERIAAALELTDPRLIELDDATREVRLAREGMRIDLGALAKGHIADLLIAHLRTEGATSAFINLGGNVLTFGRSPRQEDGRWRIGLRHPRHPDDQMVGALAVDGGSVVTSGIYRRQLQQGGRTFHHLMDPGTGHPVQTDVASLTIASSRSVDGEIWTGRLFGRPVQQILQATQAMPGLSAVVITDDLRLYASPELRDTLTLSSQTRAP